MSRIQTTISLRKADPDGDDIDDAGFEELAIKLAKLFRFAGWSLEEAAAKLAMEFTGMEAEAGLKAWNRERAARGDYTP